MNYLGLVIFLMIISLAVGISIMVSRNQSMDEANDAYRSAAMEANRAIVAANAGLRELKKFTDLPNPIRHLNEIEMKLKEYCHLYTEAEKKIKTARHKGNEAYNAYSRGVDIQNLFLGGANDLSVFSLRKRYREYREIGGLTSLDDPTMVLSTAVALVKMKDLFSDIQAESVPMLPAQGGHDDPYDQTVSQVENQAETKSYLTDQHVSPESETSETDSHRASHPFRKVWILLTILILFIVGILGYHYFGFRKNDSQRISSSGKERMNVVSNAQAEEAAKTNSAITDETVTASELAEDAMPIKEETVHRYRVTRRQGLTVRATTSKCAGRRAVLKAGEIVRAVENHTVRAGKDEWMRIITENGKSGWVLAKYLEATDD